MLAFIALVWLVSTARSGSFSCRSCAILSFYQAESSDDYTFTSYCSYAKCDDSLSPGPLCITSFGQDYTCDGSIHPWGSSVDDSYYYACKCPGPLAMPSLQINLTQPNGTVTPNTQMPINASLVDAYKPMICPTAALDMPVCSSASATEACSVVRSGQYRCTLLGRPLNGTDAASSPHTRYGLFGDTKECDNTLQSNNSYICSCPSGPGNGIVDQSLANKTSPNGVIDESGGINPTKCGTALDSAGAGLLDVDKEGFVVMASYVGRYYNADGMDMSPIVDSGSQT